MTFSFIPVWKEAPFVRILIAFIAGILIEDYSGAPAIFSGCIFIFSFLGLLLFKVASDKFRFLYYWINGVLLHLLLLATGGVIAAIKNPYNALLKAGRFISDSSLFDATILEPPGERKATWKALASINIIQQGHERLCPETNIILYFRKEGLSPPVMYGQRLIIKKRPSRIENFAHDSFDYARYCALKNIHFQVFLQAGDFVVLDQDDDSRMWKYMFSLREWLVQTVKTYIPGPAECGLALALLIGYKEELDRSLIQAYSNTGVVHVIAISGLHLGLIYMLLKQFCALTSPSRTRRWLTPLIVVPGLWIFALAAGGGPSVMRSAVMFTAIMLGETVGRTSALMNNLAASAFLLLSYNPYWLWDLGFILSYTALLSIIVFSKPLYGMIAVRHKLFDMFWKMNTVTISAQVLTTPVIVYHFRQFPNLFLVANMVAIPLSSIILFGEIIVCTICFLPGAASVAGQFVSALIKSMNRVVLYIDRLSFSSTRDIDVSFPQLIMLYVFISMMTGWFRLEDKRCLYVALVIALLFFVVEALKIW